MIDIPNGLGGIEELKRRAKKAFSVESQWETLLSDAYEYFLPNRNLFDRDDIGQKKMDRVFDSTAPYAIQMGASKLQENIAPIWSQWAMLEISEELLRDSDSQEGGVDEKSIRENLEQQVEIVFDYINRSNFATQFYEMALDLLIGTGTIYIREDDDDEIPFSFHAIPQISVGFEEGPTGTIETHWRKHKVVLRNLERTWKGMDLSQNMKERVKKDPDGKVACTEGIVFYPELGTYHGVVWIDEEERISWSEDFGANSPLITGRYAKVAGEVRGRGPAVMVLPDVKSLNKAKEFSLEKAAIDLAGMWTGTDDGVTNPYTFTIGPGIVVPVGSNNTSNPSIVRLDTGGPVDLSLFVIEDLKNAIKIALFNDLRDPQGPVRTATEIAIEARELAKRIGSAYGRLQTEVLMPILKRVMSILVRRGKIKSIIIDGKAVDIKFTSPLARSQDMEDLMSVQQAVDFVRTTAGQEAVILGYKTEDFTDWAAKKVGMPAELVRSKEEKAKAAQAAASAATEGADVSAEAPIQ